MALKVIDRAMQSFGAEGISQDQELAQRWAGVRTLRIADVSFRKRDIMGQRTERETRDRMRCTCNKWDRESLGERRCLLRKESSGRKVDKIAIVRSRV